MAKATARHILVNSEEQCQSLKNEIEGGADFAELAKQHSSCPSGQRGGDLGEFGPGMMVPEFDKVVFSADVGTVQGPVKTQFGYHLLEVTSRSDVNRVMPENPEPIGMYYVDDCQFGDKPR